ncbi:hypothetical protein BH09SUM1_BH09SUM1_05960 [soil metagenome]
MRTVTTKELQENLSDILEEVEQGGEIMLSSREQFSDEEKRRRHIEAIDDMIEFQKLGLTLGDMTIRQLRDEGRRY